METELYRESYNSTRELIEIAHLEEGDILVVGCSTSEVAGARIGSASVPELAEEIFMGIWTAAKEAGVYLAAQCCEHLNRAIIVEKEAVPFSEKNIRKNFLLKRSQQVHINRFIGHFLNVKSFSDFSDIDKFEFDAIVVGSDQIWRREYLYANWDKIDDAFLGFSKDWDLKRISYSASFGLGFWDYNRTETRRLINLINRFDAISVRETSGVDLCKEYFHRDDVVTTLDPTMLLGATDYNKLIEAADDLQDNAKGNLVYYILDEDEAEKKIIKDIATSMNIGIIRANSKIEDKNSSEKERIQPPIEQWLKWISDAKFVVTDSFHACVFCILFHKDFCVLTNSNRGNARLMSLLSLFGLQNRIIDKLQGLGSLQYEANIDYHKVDATLEKQRSFSLNYLRQSLS